MSIRRPTSQSSTKSTKSELVNAKVDLKKLVSLAASSLALGAGLVACANPVELQPAEEAAAVSCAEAIVRLPETIGELASRITNQQSTAAWGDPAQILLRCGLEVPVFSNELCIEVNGVDWLSLANEDGSYQFISYGRNPAIEVLVAAEAAENNREILLSLERSVLQLEKQYSCLDRDSIGTG